VVKGLYKFLFKFFAIQHLHFQHITTKPSIMLQFYSSKFLDDESFSRETGETLSVS